LASGGSLSGGGPDEADTWQKGDDIYVLNLFPHAMVQANAFYSPEAKGILFGYFAANKTNQGETFRGSVCLPVCLTTFIAHEVTHAVIDGNPCLFHGTDESDVLAFHEAFADLAALFSHFSHSKFS